MPEVGQEDLSVNSPFFSLRYRTVASAIYDFKVFSILQPLDNVESTHPRRSAAPGPAEPLSLSVLPFAFSPLDRSISGWLGLGGPLEMIC